MRIRPNVASVFLDIEAPEISPAVLVVVSIDQAQIVVLFLGEKHFPCESNISSFFAPLDQRDH
jgi:hypothetical protein